MSDISAAQVIAKPPHTGQAGVLDRKDAVCKRLRKAAVVRVAPKLDHRAVPVNVVPKRTQRPGHHRAHTVAHLVRRAVPNRERAVARRVDKNLCPHGVERFLSFYDRILNCAVFAALDSNHLRSKQKVRSGAFHHVVVNALQIFNINRIFLFSKRCIRPIQRIKYLASNAAAHKIFSVGKPHKRGHKRHRRRTAEALAPLSQKHLRPETSRRYRRRTARRPAACNKNVYLLFYRNASFKLDCFHIQ